MEEPMETQTNEVMTIQSEAITLEQSAKSIQILTENDYRSAADFLVKCRQTLKKIDEFCQPSINAAHSAHKLAIKQKNDLSEPIVKAERIITPKINNYRAEQERLRRAEEERLRKEAQRIADEEKLALAIQMEESGDILASEVVMETPVYVAPTVVKSAVPKVNGISDREYWSFKIINEDLIPREYKVIDEKKIAAVVRALKDKTPIPGIQVFSTKELAVRSK